MYHPAINSLLKIKYKKNEKLKISTNNRIVPTFLSWKKNCSTQKKENIFGLARVINLSPLLLFLNTVFHHLQYYTLEHPIVHFSRRVHTPSMVYLFHCPKHPINQHCQQSAPTIAHPHTQLPVPPTAENCRTGYNGQHTSALLKLHRPEQHPPIYWHCAPYPYTPRISSEHTSSAPLAEISRPPLNM